MIDTRSLSYLRRYIRTQANHATDATRARVIGTAIERALGRHVMPEDILEPKDAVTLVVAIYLAIPWQVRFVLHEIAEGAINRWLPDGHPLKVPLHHALTGANFATEAFLNRMDLDDAKIRAAILPTIEERWHARRAPPPAPAAAAAAPPPSPKYFEQRAKLRPEVRAVYDRIIACAERESRPGHDVYPQIEGVAAILRVAAMEAIEGNGPEAMNTLVVDNCGNLTALAEMTDEEFLAHVGVQRVISKFVADYRRRRGTLVSPEIADQLDELFGVFPPWLQGPLKRFLNVEAIEDAGDRIENVLYPIVLGLIRAVYSFVMVSLGGVLAGIAVLSALLTASEGEYAVGREVFSFAEFTLLRGGGAAANHLFTFAIGVLYVALGVYAWWPYARRPAFVAPQHPAERLARLEGETNEEYDVRVGLARESRFLARQHAENTARLRREFEEADDAWRERVRNTLAVRLAVVVWSVTILPAVTLLLSVIVIAYQFQWVTLLMLIAVLFLVSFIVLWPVDDIFSALSKSVGKSEGEGAGHEPSGMSALRIVRGHKISTTCMIVVLAGTLIYVPAIMLTPPLTARVMAFFTMVVVGLSAILPSRIQAGDSAESTKDVREEVANVRRAMVARIPARMAVVMLALFFPLVIGIASFLGYQWNEECYGFEKTPECSALAHGGIHAYVDNHERWVAMRNRSAKALARKGKPYGDACAVATLAVQRIEERYETTVRSRGKDTPPGGSCESLGNDAWLRGKLPAWANACATWHVACKEDEG